MASKRTPQKKKPAPPAKPAKAAAPKKKVPRKRVQTKGPVKRLTSKRADPTEGHVRNMIELSAALQRSTFQLSRLGGRYPDKCPGKDEKAGYHVEKWRTFISQIEQDDDDEFTGLKKDKLAIENWRTEQQGHIYRIKKDHEEGRIAYQQEVIDTLCQEMLPGFIQALRRMKREVADAGTGLKRDQLARLVEDKTREALDELARGDWAQKKTFWHEVYARLCARLQNLNFGDGPKPTSATSRTRKSTPTTPPQRRSSGRSSTRSGTRASGA